MKAAGVNERQEPSTMADESRTISSGDGDLAARPDLLRVALAAWAAHLDRRARARVPGATTPWGQSARLANLRRFDAR